MSKRTTGRLLHATGVLQRVPSNPEDEHLGEPAEAFDIGETGRIEFFRDDFRSATYFEEDWRRELAIRTTRDVVVVSDYLWNK